MKGSSGNGAALRFSLRDFIVLSIAVGVAAGFCRLTHAASGGQFSLEILPHYLVHFVCVALLFIAFQQQTLVAFLSLGATPQWAFRILLEIYALSHDFGLSRLLQVQIEYSLAWIAVTCMVSLVAVIIFGCQRRNPLAWLGIVTQLFSATLVILMIFNHGLFAPFMRPDMFD
jgi:hypothetical protein